MTVNIRSDQKVESTTKEARDPFTGVQIRVGVMGSAGGDVEPVVLEICQRLGRAIGERGCCLLTGACPGMPHAAVLRATGTGKRFSKQS